MSTAKNKHLETYEWSTRLARQHRVCVRSALRGLGPGRQCEELPLEDFVGGAVVIAGQPGVPIGLENTCTILYFFVLREIELGAMLAKSVGIDQDKAVVNIKLPATKSDPWPWAAQGRGAAYASRTRQTMPNARVTQPWPS